MKQFKYTARFDAIATIEKKSFGAFEAKASIDELKELRALLPTDEIISENDDLLFCSFNLAVAGLINQNGHGVTPEMAVKIADSFRMKAINIEHDRYRNCGHIISSGFSSFPDNKIISAEEASKSKQPFNLCMGGVLWKVTDPWMVDYVKQSNDKEDWSYKKISTSWEVGFSEIAIARGSRNLFDAEIITDEKEVERLSKYLIQMGGSGFDNKNKEVYMIISGDARGLAAGITENPAAAVSGIYVPEIEDPEDDPEGEIEDNKCKSSASIENDEKKSPEIENKISQPTKITVKRINLMKFKDIDHLIDSYQEAVASNQAFAASDLREFIKTEMVKSVEPWKSQVDEEKTRVAAAEKKVAEMQAAIDVAKDDAKTNAEALAEIKKELNEVKAQADEAAKRQVFDSRMSELDEKYDFTDKVRKVVAKSILNKSDEEFADWLSNEGEVILAGKEKKVVEVEDALKEVKASKEIIPNASAENKQEEAKPLKSSIKPSKDGYTISIS